MIKKSKMYDSNNITKTSDLENNNSLSRYKHYVAQQNHYAYECFYNLLERVRPIRILEIGTALGGFTAFLKHACDDLELNVHIRSYDIHITPSKEELVRNGVDFRQENIFTSDYKSLENSEIIEFIQSDGCTIVLCDGGSKINEFRILSEHLKTGDLIMAHDYAYNSEIFLNEINKVYWNWHEISESDIQDSVEKYNLKSFMQDEFNKAVWVCKIRE